MPTLTSISRAVALCLLVLPALALGQPVGAWGAPLEVHGFVSPGYIKSFGNSFLAKDSEDHGSFEFSEVGINFTSALTDRLRAGMQLFARDLGPIGSYRASFDWFYLDYRLSDLLGVRAGRMKIPFGLYNELSDIDASRLPILLPQSIYPIVNRELLLAQTGAEVYGNLGLASAGALEYRLYGGTVSVPLAEATTLSSPALGVLSVDTPYLFGGRLMWETPLWGLRLGASGEVLRLDFDVEFIGLPSQLRMPAQLVVFSAEYLAGAWTFAAEYSQWHVQLEGPLLQSLPGPVDSSAVNERYYGLASVRLADWFHPGVYYAETFADRNERSSPTGYVRDLALTLRFDPMEHLIVKVEGHAFEGWQGLNADIEPTPLADRPLRWGALLFKTTAYF